MTRAQRIKQEHQEAVSMFAIIVLFIWGFVILAVAANGGPSLIIEAFK